MLLQRIQKHENAHLVYQKQLQSEGVVKQEQIDEIHDNVSKILSTEFEQASLQRHYADMPELHYNNTLHYYTSV